MPPQRRSAIPPTEPSYGGSFTATVDGHTWQTSVWRETIGRTRLALPKQVRGTKGDGDRVRVTLRYRSL